MAGGWFKQTARALSRLGNALAGGDGDTTLSAGAWDRSLRGRAPGASLVRLIDRLPWNGAGHCKAAWLWHVEHGLLDDVRNRAPRTVLPPSLAPAPPKGA